MELCCSRVSCLSLRAAEVMAALVETTSGKLSSMNEVVIRSFRISMMLKYGDVIRVGVKLLT